MKKSSIVVILLGIVITAIIITLFMHYYNYDATYKNREISIINSADKDKYSEKVITNKISGKNLAPIIESIPASNPYTENIVTDDN